MDPGDELTGLGQGIIAQDHVGRRDPLRVQDIPLLPGVENGRGEGHPEIPHLYCVVDPLHVREPGRICQDRAVAEGPGTPFRTPRQARDDPVVLEQLRDTGLHPVLLLELQPLAGELVPDDLLVELLAKVKGCSAVEVPHRMSLGGCREDLDP